MVEYNVYQTGGSIPNSYNVYENSPFIECSNCPPIVTDRQTYNDYHLSISDIPGPNQVHCFPYVNICYDCEKAIMTTRQGYGYSKKNFVAYFCEPCFIIRHVQNKGKPIYVESNVNKKRKSY